MARHPMFVKTLMRHYTRSCIPEKMGLTWDGLQGTVTLKDVEHGLAIDTAGRRLVPATPLFPSGGYVL
jgi:hypothetical protein